MKKVQFKYWIESEQKYRQKTITMDLPKDQYGFILENEITKKLYEHLSMRSNTNRIIWHRILN